MDSIVKPVLLYESSQLSQRLGCSVMIATETFQRTGSFKFRAASQVALSVSNRCILTASSGNFGQAIALACQMTNKQAIVVMPHNSSSAKIEAVREYGGCVELMNVGMKSRAERIAELSKQIPEAYVASPYDDDFVLQGNSTLGYEIASGFDDGEAVIAPIGGGGLAAGIILGMRKWGSEVEVYGAEPSLANDAARSLRAGFIVADSVESPTIADGARTLRLGNRNWAILKSGLSGIIEVKEEHICEAMRLLFQFANLKAEPTGALSVAALLSEPNLFQGRRVCCVISGGNVDAALYAGILRTA